MQISTITVRDISNRWESLSLCLQAIARWAGVELHFRSINAALGLSFMISAPRRAELSPSWWMTLGRDAFLVETGRLFGLTLQPLELPPAVLADATSPEAFEAFAAEVHPRISAALGENKPVLAWQGWPDYHSYLWGVVTGECPGELGFEGTTMWAAGKRLPLSSPPACVYLVEETRPCQPDGDELFRFALSNIRKLIHGQAPVGDGVVTGMAAYDRWLSWLMTGPGPHPEGQRAGTAHHQMARFVTYNRESACRFVDHYKDGLHERMQPYLEAMLADCRGVINVLATARDLKAVEVLVGNEDGREALAAGVHAARDFLEAQIKTVDHLAPEVGVR